MSDSGINPAEETAKWDASMWDNYRKEVEHNKESGLNELASKFKAYRMLLHLSQEDFAKKISVPPASYRNYENGHRYPKNMDIINKAAVALGTTTEELLGESGGYIVEAACFYGRVTKSIRIGTRLEKGFYILVWQHVCQAVATEQIDIVGLYFGRYLRQIDE